MHDVGLLAIRAVNGGLFVVVFALIGEVLKPKRFARLFGAAPSIALANLRTARNGPLGSQYTGYTLKLRDDLTGRRGTSHTVPARQDRGSVQGHEMGLRVDGSRAMVIR